MKNELESTENRADHVEERISELEYRNLEMVQLGERELISKKKGRGTKYYV